MKVCRRCYVSGRVQGVFFRASTRDKAQSLHLTGHARNLDDGSVEVVACGEESAVAELVDWLWEGSPAARVESVEVEDAGIEEVPADFRTL